MRKLIVQGAVAGLAGCMGLAWAAGAIAQSANGTTANAPTMSVEAAYRAIPHRRTVFNPAASAMGPADRQYFTAFFALVDEAIVQRVGALEWGRSGGQRGAPAERYVSILERLEGMDVPARLRRVHQLVVDAIRAQHRAVQEWQETGRLPDLHHDPWVNRASENVREAHDALRRLFPNERARTTEAFRDYLGALDFL